MLKRRNALFGAVGLVVAVALGFGCPNSLDSKELLDDAALVEVIDSEVEQEAEASTDEVKPAVDEEAINLEEPESAIAEEAEFDIVESEELDNAASSETGASDSAANLITLGVLNDETLGDPGIAIADGSGIVIAGVGLANGPDSIVIDVPGSVEQALLYWSGQHRDPAGDDTITADFDGNVQVLLGTLIGGPRVFFFNMGAVSFSTYRADVTAFVQTGLNTIEISDMDFDDRNLGAGLLVIFDDGTTSHIELRDGQDLAFLNFAPPLNATVPQTFNFAPAASDRMGSLSLFACSVEEGRPNTIRVTVNGTTTDYPNLLNSMDGHDWDSIVLDVEIPAGVSSLTVEVISGDGVEFGVLPASLNWLAAGLSVPEEEEEEFTGCTPGYWKTSTPQDRDYSHWPAPYEPDDALSSVFDIPACLTASNIQNGTLLTALNFPGGSGVNGGARILLRAAVAGLLNAQLTDNGCGNYPAALSDLIDDVNDALASCDRDEMISLAGDIDDDNNLGCPQNAHGACQD